MHFLTKPSLSFIVLYSLKSGVCVGCAASLGLNLDSGNSRNFFCVTELVQADKRNQDSVISLLKSSRPRPVKFHYNFAGLVLFETLLITSTLVVYSVKLRMSWNPLDISLVRRTLISPLWPATGLLFGWRSVPAGHVLHSTCGHSLLQ